MAIGGFQPMTLLDYPGKLACTVFFSGCQFRCPWCHNWSLVEGRAPEIMAAEDLAEFLKKRQGLLEGVCFTGGEPLLARELESLMGLAHRLGFLVKLDTNGFLTDRLQDLVKRGLVDYVAMDIKNAPERYAETVGVKRLDLAGVDASIQFLLSRPVAYEFRTTVIDPLHDEASIRRMGAWIAGADRLYLQAFEPSELVPDRSLKTPTPAAMQRYQRILSDQVKEVKIRGLLLNGKASNTEGN